jgi:hypothetical protein
VVQVEDAAERATAARPAQRGREFPGTDSRDSVANARSSWEILRRVRKAGCEGGKTAHYSLLASPRPKSAKPLVGFEGLPAEFSQP